MYLCSVAGIKSNAVGMTFQLSEQLIQRIHCNKELKPLRLLDELVSVQSS
jgi:hypothetical protein